MIIPMRVNMNDLSELLDFLRIEKLRNQSKTLLHLVAESFYKKAGFVLKLIQTLKRKLKRNEKKTLNLC